ncbi:MAG: PD-(D/E)XK nuclease family protein [Limnochordia bacterium]|jgi:hypothetical protein|nr:PD-(D/E)XK nuclease family protein [Limnochordia bacterium]
MSGYVRREYPQWSWSFSRHQTLTSCPRRYYYNYYGSHNGWESGAAPEAVLAYRLKKLSNLYLLLGDALHKSAYRMVERVTEGRELPGPDVVEDEIRRRLRSVWRSSRDEGELFRRRPNRVDMLQEFYYQLEISEATLAKINERISKVSEALVASSVWEELAAKGVALVACEQFDTFSMGETPVFAVPDLLYKRPDGIWTIVDWKTGEEVEDNADQMGLYALYVHKKHGIPAEQIRARLEYLSLQTQKEAEFTAKELQGVVTWARESMEQMQELLIDVSLNIPKPKDDFALTDARAMCPWCNFYELCQKELERVVS